MQPLPMGICLICNNNLQGFPYVTSECFRGNVESQVAQLAVIAHLSQSPAEPNIYGYY